jgi:hypothetical protein
MWHMLWKMSTKIGRNVNSGDLFTQGHESDTISWDEGWSVAVIAVFMAP